MPIITARVGTLMVFACLTVVFVGNALHFLIAHNRRPESSSLVGGHHCTFCVTS